MKTLIVSITFSFLLLGCSDTGPVSELPKMNSYDDEQNIVLKKFGWLGFPPSIVRTEKISEGLAVIFGYGGNVLVSVGDDGVLIVDSQFPEVYEAIMAEIRELGGDSVDYIINTHFHFDHAEGNRAFGMQGAKIIAHQNSVEFFERGADIDMVAISWPQQVYEKEARPTMTYSDQMTLNFNGQTIEIRNYGPAHTTGDSFIFFRESNVLHMGDVANLTGLPYIDAGNGGTVDGMIYSIKKALQMTDENTVVVPGHGEISGREDLEIYLAKIELVRNRIFNMIEDGLNLQEILQADPASEVFPSSPFDAAIGIPASHTFVDRAYASMTKK